MSEQEKIDVCRHYLDKWHATLKELCESHGEFERCDLRHFLAPDSHQATEKWRAEIANKAELMVDGDAKLTVAGRPGTGWMAKHQAAYKKKLDVAWSSPEFRRSQYAANSHFLSRPLREQDIVLFWDLKQPVSPDSYEESLELFLDCRSAYFDIILRNSALLWERNLLRAVHNSCRARGCKVKQA